ncbi:ninjurin-2 isoform X3 [Zootermopsis nevadensis]|uniref:Ninjurin-1 n=1 Tax=Zootermopsis nevadensis TaxID=136037 RepID=A0A067RAN1_ZOONE|nr:ninjurin-2 isoform X3 [Zootermopsis nevadensis]KDR20905.1 Ninjurin-1 [Zootermopsis nevadensis]
MSTAAITPEMGNRGKPLDANSYATKKTIAQGMLDIALLTANASQLKYVLQIGHQHEFYTLMLWLISVSIVLQACQGVLYVMLGSVFNINKTKDQGGANLWNNVVFAMGIITTIVNIIISAFDMRETEKMGSNITMILSGNSQ